MSTIRREIRMKFEAILFESVEAIDETMVFRLAEKLTDAALEVAGIKKTDETPGEYNVELFRGDFHDYPEHLWKIAECLRDTWKFVLPEKPRKGSAKGKYSMTCIALNAIKDGCAEFGVDVLVKVHEEWRSKFRDGIAPYTVAQPTSLINVCAGKARELRESRTSAASTRTMPTFDDNGRIING